MSDLEQNKSWNLGIVCYASESRKTRCSAIEFDSAAIEMFGSLCSMPPKICAAQRLTITQVDRGEVVSSARLSYPHQWAALQRTMQWTRP